MPAVLGPPTESYRGGEGRDEAAAAQPVTPASVVDGKRRGVGCIVGASLFHTGLSPAVTPSTPLNGGCHSAGAPSGFNWSGEKTNTKAAQRKLESRD